MRTLTIALCLLVLAPARAEAWNPLKAAADRLRAAGRAIGGVLGAPAGGFIESTTTPAIRSAEDAGHRLISDVDTALAGNLARADSLMKQVGATVDQVDHSLTARILQVQTAVDHSADHAFDRVDLLIGRLESDAQQLLRRAEITGKNLIKQLDDTAAANLARVDKLLGARVNELQLLVTSSIQEADGVARARLEQLDELAGRRLGNLDVIATKQSLGLEGMLVRLAALIGLVGLIAFVSWRLFREVADALALADQRGRSRLRTVGWCSLTRLVPQLALAAAGALALIVLSKHLPRDAEDRACAQIKLHLEAFGDAARALDVIGARYHASQLEILAPDGVAAVRRELRKTELLHSLFTRPGQLHTQQGLASLVAEVGEVEAAFAAAPAPADPDLLIAKAYVLWQVGGTRDDEHEAAMLCARALQHGPRALLAPLARNYISVFLDDPYVSRDAADPGRDELVRLAGASPAPGETRQFDRVIELDTLIRKLDRRSTAAYLDMLTAQAELRVALAAGSRGPEPVAARTARAARTAAANQLIEAWADFDRALESSPALASDAMVLSVFTLDDSVLSRARYYAEVPAASDLPPMLTAQPPSRALSPALRARIAPLRVAWEMRYAPLLGPQARDIVAYEETRRFEALEQRAQAFETAYVEFLVAARTGAAPARLLELGTAAALRASGMGLYRGSGTARVTEASRILAVAGATGHQPPDEVSTSIALNYGVRRLRIL